MERIRTFLGTSTTTQCNDCHRVLTQFTREMRYGVEVPVCIDRADCTPLPASLINSFSHHPEPIQQHCPHTHQPAIRGSPGHSGSASFRRNSATRSGFVSQT